MEKLIKRKGVPKSQSKASAKTSTMFSTIMTVLGKSKQKKDFQRSKSIQQQEEKRMEFRYDVAFALLGVLFFLFIVAINYMLIGNYLSCIFFAIVSSVALRPTKDRIINNIQKAANGQVKFYRNATFLRLWPGIKYTFEWAKISLINIYKKVRGQVIQEQTPPAPNAFKKLRIDPDKVGGFFDDINILIYATVLYILLFRLSFFVSLLVIILFLVLDFITRLSIDLTFSSCNKLCGKSFFLVKNDNKRVNANIHQLVGSSLICIFLVVCFVIIVAGVILFFIDLQDLGEFVVDQIPDDQDWFLGMLGFDSLSEFRIFLNTQIDALTLKVAQNFEVKDVMMPVTPKNTTAQVFNQAIRVANATIVTQLGPESLLSQANQSSIVIEECVKSYTDSVPEFAQPALYYICQIKMIITNADIEWGSLLSFIGTSALGAGMSFAKMGKFLLKHLLGFLFNFGLILSDWVFFLLLYFTSVDYMLADQSSALSKLSKVMPIGERMKKRVTTTITKSIEGVFLCSFKIFIYHCIFTWLIFDLFSVSFAFTYAFVCGLLTFIPLFAPALLVVPAAISIYLQNENIWLAGLLAIIYFFVINKIESDLYSEEQLGLNSFWTGFAAVFGVTAFGLEGFFTGPLICSLTTIIFKFLGEGAEDAFTESDEEDIDDDDNDDDHDNDDNDDDEDDYDGKQAILTQQ